MDIRKLSSSFLKIGLGLACAAFLTACSGGSSSSSSGGGSVTGVATPSKVSVVNTN